VAAPALATPGSRHGGRTRPSRSPVDLPVVSVLPRLVRAQTRAEALLAHQELVRPQLVPGVLSLACSRSLCRCSRGRVARRGTVEPGGLLSRGRVYRLADCVTVTHGRGLFSAPPDYFP